MGVSDNDASTHQGTQPIGYLLTLNPSSSLPADAAARLPIYHGCNIVAGRLDRSGAATLAQERLNEWRNENPFCRVHGVFMDDTSLSEAGHARITLTEDASDIKLQYNKFSSHKYTCCVMAMSNKHRTHVVGNTIAPSGNPATKWTRLNAYQSPVELRSGDLVCFGKLQCRIMFPWNEEQEVALARALQRRTQQVQTITKQKPTLPHAKQPCNSPSAAVPDPKALINIHSSTSATAVPTAVAAATAIATGTAQWCPNNSNLDSKQPPARQELKRNKYYSHDPLLIGDLMIHQPNAAMAAAAATAATAVHPNLLKCRVWSNPGDPARGSLSFEQPIVRSATTQLAGADGSWTVSNRRNRTLAHSLSGLLLGLLHDEDSEPTRGMTRMKSLSSQTICGSAEEEAEAEDGTEATACKGSSSSPGMLHSHWFDALQWQAPPAATNGTNATLPLKANAMLSGDGKGISKPMRRYTEHGSGTSQPPAHQPARACFQTFNGMRATLSDFGSCVPGFSNAQEAFLLVQHQLQQQQHRLLQQQEQPPVGQWQQQAGQQLPNAIKQQQGLVVGKGTDATLKQPVRKNTMFRKLTAKMQQLLHGGCGIVAPGNDTAITALA